MTKKACESVGLCPFGGFYVREFELSHSNPVNRMVCFHAFLSIYIYLNNILLIYSVLHWPSLFTGLVVIK